MCGLIAYISKNPQTPKTQEEIAEQFERQHTRGKEGFGLLEVTQNSIIVRRATEPVKALIDIRMSTSPILMFHHRMPTSTPNELEQTHPMFVSNKELEHDWYIMHNGSISNADEMHEQHIEMGYEYTTQIEEEEEKEDEPTAYRTTYGYHYTPVRNKQFNDSEALAIELARFLEGKSKVIAAHGSAAYLILKVDKQTHQPLSFLFGRNETNPMLVTIKEDGILFASEAKNGNPSPELTIKEITIADLFSTTNYASLIENAKKYPVKMAEKPAPTPIITAAPQTHTTTTTQPDLTQGERDIKGIYAQEKGFITQTEQAMYKLSQRNGLSIQNLLDDLFIEAAYKTPDTKQIEGLMDQIKTIIEYASEKTEKIRKFMGLKETKEQIDEAIEMAEDIESYNNSYEAEDGAPMINPRHNSSLETDPFPRPYV